MATYAINEQFHGIELSFDTKPAKAVLDALKNAGFRWHNVKRLWYAKQTDSRLALVQSITETQAPAAPAKKPEKRATAQKAKANKYGVKVGDLFYASWGYDQTNVDFFQVVALCGESSVRVIQVDPPMISESGYSHGMVADRTYKFTGEMLPASAHSVFINDQEKGDLKRLKDYSADHTRPQFTLSSFADAWKVTGDTMTTYESWYA